MALDTVPARLNTPQLIDTLRKAASTNKAFNAVCHMFAVRDRARQQVTIEALSLRMASEGYRFTKKDYQECLKFLASAGIGSLETKNNEVRALKGIKVTLQSLGKAALAQTNTIDNFNPAFEYQQVMSPSAPAPAVATAAPLAPPPTAKGHIVLLVTKVNGVDIEIPLPRELTTQELGELMTMVSSKRS